MSNVADWQRRVEHAYGFHPKPWERERLLEKCKITGDCWEWKGPAKFTIDGNQFPVLPMAYTMLKGDVPKDHKVMSTCGKLCCMPGHMVCFT